MRRAKDGTAQAPGPPLDPAATSRGDAMPTLTPCLWYATQAEEAARFYATVFPDSQVKRVVAMPSESPAGPPGSVKVVDFTLCGQAFTAMSAGPLDPFNHAVSFIVSCEDQAEIDRYWHALLDGGQAEQCGWLKDRYGLCWQIVPRHMGELIGDPDPARAKRACDAMMGMVKIDIAALEAARDGRG
jgi:predicted 3-demethylubiquinone-9 3-methyltransferase (glyoxalase superfamily)